MSRRKFEITGHMNWAGVPAPRRARAAAGRRARNSKHSTASAASRLP